MSTTPDDILAFWFSEHARPHWFARSEAFDAEIRRRFAPLYEHARHGGLTDWVHAPRSLLALVIVLDQFSRNMFRDSPLAFGSDALALELAELGIAKGFDVLLSPEERHFLYLPLMHAESLPTQEQSVTLYEQLGRDEALDYARQHRDIIARFGRFPHRNAVLERETTPEEAEFLKTHAGF